MACAAVRALHATLEDRAHEALRAVLLAERLGDPADLPAGDRSPQSAMASSWQR